ncbi:hypothetical protein WUBG_17973 [Wuchereria bancrofti]|uniref:Uncharacterized protein n=1 Tax=Wuchereria bancrofti TaxID=6293 RepID=J9AAZ3_WUCBA|nr:hypothetical protein WUBG_17973 [Wuchereria bancrofti]
MGISHQTQHLCSNGVGLQKCFWIAQESAFFMEYRMNIEVSEFSKIQCSQNKNDKTTLQSVQEPLGEKGLVALAVSTANIQSNRCNVRLKFSYALSTFFKPRSI